MADIYSSQHYMSSPSDYYTSPHIAHHHAHGGHTVSPPEPAQVPRKRPKYTRSKTGCLTCRVKKIKCDESKPHCQRCTHGSRECTWPEGVPARKKTPVKKEPVGARPSTANSSVSDSSSPSTRDPSPPRRNIVPVDVGLPPLISRRHNSTDPYLQLHPMPSQPDSNRHSSNRSLEYPHHPPPPSLLMHHDYSQTRHTHYDYDYDGHHSHNHTHPHSRPSSVRTLVHDHPSHPGHPSQWNSPPLLAPINDADSPYERSVMERTVLRHPSTSHHTSRY